MKKRLLSMLLAAALGIGALAGCGNAKETESSYEPVLPTEQEEAEIYVEKIDGLSEDFIKGMDISSLLAEEASGVVYYNEDGEEEDLLKILADAGINYVRVRVWNDPFDEEGNGYGGGNCTAETAAEIGKRAAEYGIRLCVDFHYSDFWADPSKQYAPKAWEDCSVEEKADLLYTYTKESLETIIKAGADVGMVQIGNEINNGMAGETSMSNVITLLESGSKAVREVAEDQKTDIKIAVHYTNIDNPDNILKIAGQLADAQLDYDIFGVSYYCFWHGTMDNLTKVLTNVAQTYGVETCVMETSYMYTGEDGDAFGNSVSAADALDEYPATVQGQANCIRDVMAAASAGGALGVFYWEGAWIPVGSSFDSNHTLWEENGSGWASSYSADYDPKDAGLYYGGSSWDNQAFFDFDGNVLPSLNVFKYVNYGAVGTQLEVLGVKDVSLEVGLGEELALPDTVEAVYNDAGCTDPLPVTWDADSVAAVDTNVAGTYTVKGTAGEDTAVTATIKIANVNYVQNPGFEDADVSMWNVTYEGDTNPTDVQEKASDAYNGDKAFHFWSESDISFTVEQTMTGLPAGTYNATANLQGGDVGSDAEVILYVVVGDTRYESDPVTLDGWVNWKSPVIKDIAVDGDSDVTIGVSLKCAAKGWGTIDDFEFYSQQ
jgi:arabinogalactan endo-1,4-beta-galactosidase